jgi:predicted enzyme related to lactoylglutathione lyase
MTTSAQAPSVTTNAVRGRFVWHDLMTTDIEGAKQFYSAIAGWGTQLWGDTTPPYTMWTVGQAPIGGTMALPDEVAQSGTPPHWLTYIESPDVDETVTRATQLGATTFVPPTDIPTVGRFAVLADPQGAMFAVFTPLTTSPAHDGPPNVGEFSWHELATSDLSAGFAFYEELFGWSKTSAMDMGGGATYQMFGKGEVPVGGMYATSPEKPMPPNWLPYIRVPDADVTAERAKSLGAMIVQGPMEVPGGDRIAVLVDPQGAAVAVHSTKG